MSIDQTPAQDVDKPFDSFEIEDLEVSQGVALPEMGASDGSIGTSSSTCCSSCCC